jgi:hypothetical protein
MSIEYEEAANSKRTQAYRKLGQGLKVLHEDQYPDVDYVSHRYAFEASY